jgi:hypothetical protein
LLGEYEFPIVVAQTSQIAIVGEIEKLLTRALLLRAGQVRQQVVAVEMHLVGHAAGLVAGEQLLLDVRHPGRGEQGRHPVEVRNDPVQYAAWFDLARPTDQSRHL